jgi:HEAT repeat protein
VRAAAIEIDLLVMNLDKEPDSAGRLIDSASGAPANRPSAAYYLGMMANRGVETDRIHDLLKQWSHEPDEQTRFWAVEGLAFIGTEDTIQDFLDVLRNDPSLNVRERAGCSLAKSGMLTREQRLKAVPGLIEIADDSSVDATTRGWAFQALREITGEGIANDASAWRNWFSSHGTERAEEFRREQNQLLGNS